MSFWSWLSSSVNFGSPCSGEVLLASSRSALASTSATVAESDMSAEVYTERCRVREPRQRSDVAQIESPQPFAAPVGAIEEAAVDAVIGLARALVGALDRELAVGQRRAGHLHPAEAAGLEHRRELDLGAVDPLHAADVLLAGQPVEVAVEEATAELDTAARLDHLVAEGAALAALANLGARGGHWQSL